MSRLVAALEERLSAVPHARLRYFCSPYHANSALYPVIKQLERAARLRPGDSSNAKLDKLEGLLRQSGSDSTDAVPLLAELLSIDTAGRYAPHGLSPQARKSHTLRTLVQLLAGLAARRPVAMIFEDVHWADPTTREWLDMLIDSLRNLPLFLVIVFRPRVPAPMVALFIRHPFAARPPSAVSKGRRSLIGWRAKKPCPRS